MGFIALLVVRCGVQHMIGWCPFAVATREALRLLGVLTAPLLHGAP